MKSVKIIVVSMGSLIGILAALFVVNGLGLARNEEVLTDPASQEGAVSQADIQIDTLKVMAYNIAKGFVHHGGIRFEKQEVIQARFQKIADLITAENPDLVFLSEVIFECGPSPINQVQFLAEKTGLRYWAFGENYNFGLPFYRIVGGNAILSRWPLTARENPSLAGRQPFYITKNNRRILWCELPLNGERVLLGAIHNDSFNLQNNLAQVQQILEYIGKQPAIIAGDFNARPDEAPIRELEHTKHFAGEFKGELTFPAQKPAQKIDFIFAPADWTLEEHRIIQSTLSDHLPVFSVFSTTKHTKATKKEKRTPQ